METVVSITRSLTSYSLEKAVVSGILAVGSFFVPNDLWTAGMSAIVVLMVIDTITGILASRIFENQPISSKKAGRKVRQASVYFLVLVAGYHADLTIPGVFIQTSLVGWVAMTELISVLENAGRCGMETPQKLLNQLKAKRAEF